MTAGPQPWPSRGAAGDAAVEASRGGVLDPTRSYGSKLDCVTVRKR